MLGSVGSMANSNKSKSKEATGMAVGYAKWVCKLKI
jgi:hypothetical protein